MSNTYYLALRQYLRLSDRRVRYYNTKRSQRKDDWNAANPIGYLDRRDNLVWFLLYW